MLTSMKQQLSRSSNLLGAFVIAVHDQMLERIESELGLGGQAAAALVVIGFNQGRNVDFLSGALRLSHSGCVRVVDKLEEAGLVQRREGKDKRVVALFLSAAGQRRMQVVLRTRSKYLDGLMQSLDARQQQQFTETIETLLYNMTSCNEHAEAMCRYCDEAACPQRDCPITLAVVK
jgi:MarR family transcriptional regulator, negative regulator of the multidrug operon emrRAB